MKSKCEKCNGRGRVSNFREIDVVSIPQMRVVIWAVLALLAGGVVAFMYGFDSFSRKIYLFAAVIVVCALGVAIETVLLVFSSRKTCDRCDGSGIIT